MFEFWRRFLAVLGSGVVLSAAVACNTDLTRPEKNKRAARRSGGEVQATGASAFVPGDGERGRGLMAAFQCNRCHAGTGLGAPKLDQDCVGCHEQIATDEFKANPSKLARWKLHVLPYRDVPSLTELGRLRPAWVRDYLLHPHDLRPNLAQTMPRLGLSPEQAIDIATYLTRSAAAAPAPVVVSAKPEHLARGKQLLTERGCSSCHRVSGAGLPVPPKNEPPLRTLGLAPDLRFARERAEPAAIARWLLDPAKVKPDAAMPNMALTAEEVRDLTAFLSFGELEPEAPPQVFERLPLLARRVSFDEVNERVFAVTCRHCHTNPDLAAGDGGPGNTGGFGFPARRIDFSSYQGVLSGGVDGAGQRVSLFLPSRDGLPRLVAALVARVREERGEEPSDVRGMPLGLPALSAEQIQLVESWVAQGRPR